MADRPVTFKDACKFVMPFGKYKGLALARIGRNDEGLRWLDWLNGQSDLYPDTKANLDCYLGNATVAMLVSKAIGA